MDLERRGTEYVLKLGKGETPRNALRSIAVASFELARPAGMGRLHFDGGTTIRPEDADRFIQDWEGGLSLSMDYVEGRQVKTKIDTNDDGEMVFDGDLFERDRGNPDPMFKRAQEILDNIETAAALPTDLTRTETQFQGASLDSKLGELGYKRNNGETDDEFKRRVFPVIYLKDPILAGEFIFGKYEPEWEDEQRVKIIKLMHTEPDINDLVDFAKSTLPLDEEGKEIKPGVDRLRQLEKYLPNQSEMVYEYARFLADRIGDGEIVPLGFAIAAELAIYDLSRGVNGFTGERINNSLTGYPPQIYGTFSAMTVLIARAAYSERFARAIEESLE